MLYWRKRRPRPTTMSYLQKSRQRKNTCRRLPSCGPISSTMPRPATPMRPTGRPVTPRDSARNMRRKSCSIRRPKMPLTIWGSRSCSRSRSYKPSMPGSWRKRKRPIPSIGAPVKKCGSCWRQRPMWIGS